MPSSTDEQTGAEHSHAVATQTGRSLLWRLIVPTCCGVAALVCAIAVYAPHEVVDTAITEALVKGEQTARQLQTLRGFYSDHVVAKATKAGVSASPTYK